MLDIPGADEERLWQELKTADGFIDRRMPDNERASAYYKQAIEAVLRKSGRPEEIAIKSEGDLGTHSMVTIFQPANLPKVREIRFEGNASAPAAVLLAALTKAAMGQEYSDRDFRRKVEANLRPVYEERGRLTAAFPGLKMASAGSGEVAVTVEINEGPVWSLGKVSLTGQDLPAAEMLHAGQFANGAPANWAQFLAAVEKMKRVPKSDGYLGVSVKPVRSFDNATHVVDVAIEVNKGRQYLFGELHVNGLEQAAQQRAMQLWKLPSGAPLNEPYIGEYLKAVFQMLKGAAHGVSQDLKVRPGTNIVDVAVTFR